VDKDIHASILLRNNVKTFGKGSQPMVFVHGFGCDQNMWRFITPAFEDDYRIVLFDYVGSGKSDISAYNPERYADLNGYTEDILDVCRALQLRDVILVGHSVSSMTGLLSAIKEPEIFHSMIFVGPSPRYINEAPDYVGGFERQDITELLETMDKNYVGWANFLAPAIMKNSERPELGEELAESFCSTDPKIARQFAEATFFSDNRHDLSKLQIPSLILQCSDDLLAPLEVGHYVHQHTPNSTLKIMKATGHCPHMSAPEETIFLIKEYLSPKRTLASNNARSSQ
jgi:sigma-B regulation protein RsbQ